ncbi:Protein of unknown function [Nitrosospira briensis]|uniref:Uncharacterized protein n=1 Tax=Nitrosospira briensis TaxID=35799 RepID=A0A1I4ZZF5_9PROT|nr:Protein of unknown function [Nitrosospira briensis]
MLSMTFKKSLGFVAQSLRLMVGVPEYSAYAEHMRYRHPDQAIMTYEEFLMRSK